MYKSKIGKNGKINCINYIKKYSIGILISLFMILAIHIANSTIIIEELLFQEVIPTYSINLKTVSMSRYEKDEEVIEVFAYENLIGLNSLENLYEDYTHIIGLDDDIYDYKTTNSQINIVETSDDYSSETPTLNNIYELGEISSLKPQMYIVDSKTDMDSDLFDISELMEIDLSIEDKGSLNEPKVLIFHTHSTEMYVGSEDISQGVLGVGERLANILNEQYGISTIQCRESFDIVDGKTSIQGAYERMEPVIQKILDENPSIEVCIDLHRDGVGENTRLVKSIDGKETAQIMFVNGLTSILDEGILTPIEYLPNPYLQENLSFSFMAQLTANTLYEGLARKIYLHAYRYSLHMREKSLLLEVGAQTNTKEEAYNAVIPIAEILASILLND